MTNPDDYLEHCGNDCTGVRDADGELENDPTPEECVHCECCCQCLGCEYGPRNGLGLAEEQQTAIAALDLRREAP